MDLLMKNLSLIEHFCVKTTFEDVGFGLATRAVGGEILGHRYGIDLSTLPDQF